MDEMRCSRVHGFIARHEDETGTRLAWEGTHCPVPSGDVAFDAYDRGLGQLLDMVGRRGWIHETELMGALQRRMRGLPSVEGTCFCGYPVAPTGITRRAAPGWRSRDRRAVPRTCPSTNGRPELRIVVDTDGTWEGLEPHPVLLDRPTLLASSRELAHGSMGTLLQTFPGLGDVDDVEELLAEFGRTVPFQVWPVVEAVTDPGVVISRWDMPGERPERAQPVKGSDGPRWESANEPTRWRVSLAAPGAGLRAV